MPIDAELLGEYIVNVAPTILVNLRMALTSIAVGILIGFFAGWARVSSNRALRSVARGYTEVVRGTPLLIQIFIVFFAFPAINRFFFDSGINIMLEVSDIQRVIIALTINTGAYQAEIFRAGFQSIASGQIEAATSIGMNKWQTMRHVILPQTLRTIAPPLTNEYIIMFKDATPLAFIVAVPELLHVSRLFGQGNAEVLGSYLMAALTFLLVSLLLALFLRLLEVRSAVPGLGMAVRKG